MGECKDQDAARELEASRAVPRPGPAMTIDDAAQAMTPPMPRRELARRLKHVAPVGTVYGRRGRRPKAYPVAEILRAHADWLREC
jgi:hypothetical protein